MKCLHLQETGLGKLWPAIAKVCKIQLAKRGGSGRGGRGERREWERGERECLPGVCFIRPTAAHSHTTLRQNLAPHKIGKSFIYFFDMEKGEHSKVTLYYIGALLYSSLTIKWNRVDPGDRLYLLNPPPPT